MPNIKSAEKRIRQSEKRRVANHSIKSKISTVRRDTFEAKDLSKEDASKLLANYASTLDKAAKRGVISSNTASRRKSRAAKRLAAAVK